MTLPGSSATGNLSGSPTGAALSILPVAVRGTCHSRRPRSPAFDPNRGFDPMLYRKYGYGWWVHEIGGYEACFAWGYGGQYIFVVPEVELVMVTTSSPDVNEERRGHRQVIFDILERLVVAPNAARLPAPGRLSQENPIN